MNFANRHIGPRAADIEKMLRTVDADDLNALIEQTIPEPIRFGGELDLPAAMSEVEVLEDLRLVADGNQVLRSMICLLYTSPSPRDS